MRSNDSPIGVFDSGLGGLTVVKELIRQCPDERIVYFGDTARVPYGSKSRATIVRYCEQIARFLSTKEVKAIVIACNTASAFALEEVRQQVNVPVIGVVQPGARVAAASTKNRKVGVIGTEGTVSSGLYARLIREERPEVRVSSTACPLLVPLVEEGWWHDEITRKVLERYLQELKDWGMDTLILGCTHYPLLRSLIREVTGEKVNLINPAYEAAQELWRLLEENGLFRKGEKADLPENKYRFYVSDEPGKFGSFAESVLEFSVPGAEKVLIEEY